MALPLDRERLLEAFERLGKDLAGRGHFVEIAVYGGSAVMLQFAWRRSTVNVDAVVREGYDEAVLSQSVAKVAGQMQLDPGWLNDAVGMFTPLSEPESLFDVAGSYPAGSDPGLRVFLARPHYLLAMELQALRSLDRGERDMTDARRLAQHLGIADENDHETLYVSIHGESPPGEARMQFAAVLGG